MKPLALLLTPLLLACGMATLPAASIIADFSGGNGTSSPNQYQGTSGSGWAGAWETFRQGGTGGADFSITGNVTDTNPMNALNPNHLAVAYAYTAAGTGSQTASAGVRRVYDQNVVDPAGQHEVSFLFRVDSVATTGNYAIYLRGSDSITSTTGSYGWTIVWSSTNGWVVYDGNKSGNITQRALTGISNTLGTVYRITLSMNTAIDEWDVSITDGTQTDGLTGLGYRTAGNYLDTTIGFVASSSTVGTTINFSVDDLAITAIPEPSTALYLLGGGALFALARRRRW